MGTSREPSVNVGPGDPLSTSAGGKVILFLPIFIEGSCKYVGDITNYIFALGIV